MKVENLNFLMLKINRRYWVEKWPSMDLNSKDYNIELDSASKSFEKMQYYLAKPEKMQF